MGLVMGTQPNGTRLVAVDIDGPPADLALISHDWPETLTARTGSGGLHLVYQWPASLTLPPNAVRLPGTCIDIRSEGGQIVVCPSVHHTGGVYAWIVQVPVVVLPEDTARAILTRAPSVVASKGPSLDLTSYTKDLADAFARAFPERGQRHDAVLCVAGMLLHRGFPEDRAIAILEGLLKQTGWEYSAVEAENDVKSTLERLVAGQRAKGAGKTSTILVAHLGKDGAEAVEAFAGRIDLKDGTLACNDKGKVLPSSSNVEKILALHPACAGALAFDEFRQDIVQVNPMPTTVEGRAPIGRTWQDAQAKRFGNWLSSRYGIELNTHEIHAQCETMARKHTFHPIRSYLRALVWDGVPRLHTLFSKYFGAEDSTYVSAVSRMFMIGAVARVMLPGCKLDTAPILIGPQGTGKSRTVAALLPDPTWFSDTKTDVGTKDAMINLQGTWIYEFAELANMSAADAETVKNFMSSALDKFRAPYARRAEMFPRQIVFIGTVNREILFTDQSGNRRFWPITSENVCDPVGAARDRDQLWAEAYLAYQSGEQWHASPEVEALCSAEQADHAEDQDPWTEDVYKYTENLCTVSLSCTGGLIPDKTDPWAGITTAQVLERALGVSSDRKRNADAQRVGNILRGIGWRAHKVKRSGKVIRVYVPGEDKPEAWTR